MHADQNLNNEDIGSIKKYQDQINEYKKKVFEKITHNKIYIFNNVFFTFN